MITKATLAFCGPAGTSREKHQGLNHRHAPLWCPRIPGLALYYPANRQMPSAPRAFIDLLKTANT